MARSFSWSGTWAGAVRHLITAGGEDRSNPYTTARVRPRGRLHWPVALGSGAAVGAVAAGLILVGYGHRSSIMLLALSVVVAGAVGGGLGAVRPAELIAAGIAGTLAAFFVAFALHVLEDPLLQLFGAASSPASQPAAASRLALTTSLLGGAAAGVTAFFALDRKSTRLNSSHSQISYAVLCLKKK